jgi:hypothetical protein
MSGIRKSTARKKREQQVKRQKLILAAVGILIVIAVMIYIISLCGKEESVETIVTEGVTEIEEVETIEITVPEKTETLEEKVERVRKEAIEAGYPEDVIELLSKNPETVDFVENYGEQKDRKPASEIAEFVEGKIPQIEQTIELNQGAGMITRKMSIDNLLARGLISRETAYEYSFDAGKNEVFEDRSKIGMAPQGMAPQGGPMQAQGRMPGPMGGTTAYLNNRR